MHLAELTAGFQWGVLLVTDANSVEQIPNWSSPDEQVTTAGSALVVKVMPDTEGVVSISVVNNEKEVHGTCVFSGRLAVPSKVLKVSDALGEQRASVLLDKEDIGIGVFLDEPAEATSVSLLLSE